MVSESVKASMQTLNHIESLAGRYGLFVRGGLAVQDEDDVPQINEQTPARTLILFGNVGSSIWKTFSLSEEYARKAESLVNSRLGMLMHPKYGLWHAYRFAIALPFDIEIDSGNPADVCATCPDQPCITACPVNAFEVEMEFDARACYTHLAAGQNTDCRTGCQARLSCPYASGFRYQQAQTEFHMKAYIKNMSRRL